MTVDMPLLRGLRHSLLGAWLAVAYALAVLASALAPSPATAHAIVDGAILCSGLALPGQDSQELPEPASGSDHCKGCPVNPVLAGPPQALQAAVARASAHDVARPARETADVPPAAPGLPPSRAPPASADQPI